MPTEITLPVMHDPAKRMTLNDRDHYHVSAVKTAAWRTMGWAAANTIQRTARLDGIALIVVQFGTNRPNQRRDPSNWAPTVKALVDGITDSGRFWADDDSKNVYIRESRFTIDIPNNHHQVVITYPQHGLEEL